MVKQPGLLAADAVIQADQQAVQPPSQVFVLSRVHAPHSGAGKGSEQPASQPGLRVTGK
jgi:hypothetical protein